MSPDDAFKPTPFRGSTRLERKALIQRLARPTSVLLFLAGYSGPSIAAEDYTALAHGWAIALFWLACAVVAFLVGAVQAMRERSWLPFLLPMLYIGIGFLLFALATYADRLSPDAMAGLLPVVGVGAPILAAVIAYGWYRAIRRGR
jgi:hypothetical protein